MDNSACAVLYLDRRARSTGHLTSNILDRAETDLGDEDAAHNIHTLLSVFGEVFVCSDGLSCLSKLTQLDEPQNSTPVVVLLDMPTDDEDADRQSSWDARSSSPTTLRRPKVEKNEPSDLYGIHLLLYLASEIQQRARSRLVIPVTLLRTKVDLMTEPFRMSKYLDVGAVDVLTSPLVGERAQALAVHAYRRFKEVSREQSSFLLEKRNRKLSWVGIDEERPYAYLREVMVSGLMNGICNPETVGDSLEHSDLDITHERRNVVRNMVGTWSFSAHDLNADELLYAALVMLEHALQMPELERWRMPTGDLTIFLMACRKAYNDFVLYHNFRHIVDVLQAVFYFLLQIGILPAYPRGDSPSRAQLTAVAGLLQPFDALTLLISAIGHDVGHPGVNNAFLVALNAPLAQLYNDRSVLEAFHCAAYSQILRRYWPEAFADTGMRKLMINSILATDMGLHFKYMVDMGNLQERLAANDNSIEGWAPKALEETRDLCCGLLIKCADISNVARKYDIAAQWAAILTDEFSNQGAMEKELDLPTCLFGGPPDRGDVIKMAESQIGFMNIFAGPLFEGMTNILPPMSFGNQEMGANRLVWERKIDIERARRGSVSPRPVGEGAEISLTTIGTPDAQNADLTHEIEALPPLPVERDSLMSPPRSIHGTDDQLSKHSLDTNIRPLTHNDAISAAERRLRNASMGSLSPTKGPRKPSSSGSYSGSFHAPYSNPFAAHHHSGSRRSSKDAALETLEQMQFNSFSRVDNQSFDPARRGSADASLTTILVRSQTPQNKQDGTSSGNTSSPSKRYPRSSSQPSNLSGCPSMPASLDNVTNNTLNTTGPQSPPSSTSKPSSVNDTDYRANVRGEPSAYVGGAFLTPNPSTPGERSTLSAPGILTVGDVQQSKLNSTSHLSKDGGEQGEEAGRNGHQMNLRQSRSRSRLRGLKFWRKRWKSPSGMDVENDE